MSVLKKNVGYTISAGSLAGAVAIVVDRYSEFVSGAEGLMSWGLPPLALVCVAVTALITVRLGHPSESPTDA